MDDNYERLTNEAKLLLLKIYQEYQTRRSAGMNRERAKTFSYTPGELGEKLGLEDNEEDIFDFAAELSAEEFVQLQFGSDSFGILWLTNVAIARMQNRFKDGVKVAIGLLVKAI